MNALSDQQRDRPDAEDLTEAERARILAKTARFDPPPAQLADGRRELVGLSRDEMLAELAAIGEKPFRAKQVWHWIYHQGVTDFSLMSSIARPLQERLAEHFVIGRPEAALVQTSSDDTRKFLFRFRDGQEAETVYIPIARKIAAQSASPPRSAAPCRANSATPAPRRWCATSAPPRSSASLWRPATAMANGQARAVNPRGCCPRSC